MSPLIRARRAAARRSSAMQEYRDAIVAAHTAGHSLREIGKAVGTSHVAVLQILKRG